MHQCLLKFISKKFIKILILTFFGLYGSFSIFFESKNFILKNIEYFSPLPIIFSKRPTEVKLLAKPESNYIFNKYYFDFYSDDQNFLTKIFDRNYHDHLTGPHRHKVFHYFALKDLETVENTNNKLFYHDFFCLKKEAREAFKISYKPKKVIIRSNKRIIHELECS